MEYIDDYLSEEKIDLLDEALAKIYDDDSFIIDCLSALDSDDEADKLLDFLSKHENIDRFQVVYFLIDLINSRETK